MKTNHVTDTSADAAEHPLPAKVNTNRETQEPSAQSPSNEPTVQDAATPHPATQRKPSLLETMYYWVISRL